MVVEAVTYEFVDPEILPGVRMRIIIEGADIEQRAMPIAATVGAQPVLWIMPLAGDQPGVQGFLEAEPNVGDRLQIGYVDEAIIDTEFTYDPNIA